MWCIHLPIVSSRHVKYLDVDSFGLDLFRQLGIEHVIVRHAQALAAKGTNHNSNAASKY